MNDPRHVLVVQTAFPGDVILTLPLVQALRSRFPAAGISFVATPAASVLLHNHPAIDSVIVFDKRGADRGVGGLRRLAKRLRALNVDIALIPHRSLRSALVCRLARIPVRIAFDRSAGRLLCTHLVHYEQDRHEIARNLALLEPVAGFSPAFTLPLLYPASGDREVVDALLRERNSVRLRFPSGGMVAVAPGSVWATKRWLGERYADLCAMLLEKGHSVVLIGGPDDQTLCTEIADGAGESLLNAAGRLSLLQSAELIRRCGVLVSNDSAPAHLAVAVGTPVVAIFGPTVPEFGFAPQGADDRVLQTPGLACRPCSIHGGQECPIGTFECMKAITPPQVLEAVESVLARTRERI